MQDVGFFITAVPERLENARKLVMMTDGYPFVDHFHKGNIWNKFRAYKEAFRLGYSHVCMMDDDVVLPDNFVHAVSAIVERFPDAIITFYNSKIGSDSPVFFRLRNHYMNGASCVIPTKYLPAFLSFFDQNLAADNFKWDDTAMSMFALLNGIDVLLVCPKVIDVLEMPSSLPMRKKRVQPHNAGAICGDSVDIDALMSAPVMDISGGALNTHLPKDHPINILCAQKCAVNSRR